LETLIFELVDADRYLRVEDIWMGFVRQQGQGHNDIGDRCAALSAP
jgi:hypothetical protein